MFEHGTIKFKQELSGFRDLCRIDADLNLSYQVSVYAPEDEVWTRVNEDLREMVMSDLEIDQDKLALVSDIPIEDLRSIKQRYRTGDLYDSFGRVLFTGRKS